MGYVYGEERDMVWGGKGYVYGEERDMVWGGKGYVYGEERDMCMCMGKNGVTS